jgi:hypothetical protein
MAPGDGCAPYHRRRVDVSVESSLGDSQIRMSAMSPHRVSAGVMASKSWSEAGCATRSPGFVSSRSRDVVATSRRNAPAIEPSIAAPAAVRSPARDVVRAVHLGLPMRCMNARGRNDDMDSRRVVCAICFASSIASLACSPQFHDHGGVYTTREPITFTGTFADGSPVPDDSRRDVRVEISDGLSPTPLVRVTYRAEHAASGRNFAIECSGRGTRTPVGSEREFFTITSPRCNSTLGSCPMLVDAPIVFRPAARRTWEIASTTEITTPNPHTSGCRSMPTRFVARPIEGFRKL